MIKEGSENKPALLTLLIYYLKKKNHKNLTFHWTKTIENGQLNFSQIHIGQLLVPLEILMNKMSLKYIPIRIHNFEHSRVIMNMKLSSHGFLFHRNINRRENKAQIPLIIQHISDVQQKIIELHKLVKWL